MKLVECRASPGVWKRESFVHPSVSLNSGVPFSSPSWVKVHALSLTTSALKGTSVPLPACLARLVSSARDPSTGCRRVALPPPSLFIQPASGLARLLSRPSQPHHRVVQAVVTGLGVCVCVSSTTHSRELCVCLLARVSPPCLDLFLQNRADTSKAFPWTDLFFFFAGSLRIEDCCWCW